MITTYEMAYIEVLALLRNYLSELEFNKIPKEKIDFFEKYKDRNYMFEINKELPIEKQDISKKANAIIPTEKDLIEMKKEKWYKKLLLFIKKRIIGKK